MMLLALFFGCGAPVPGLECGGATVTGQITAGPTDEVLDAALTVRGTAQHATGLAIRSVSIGGVQAEALSSNFSSWEAEISIGALVGAASDEDTDGVGALTLQAEAIEVCGGNAGLAPLPIGEAFTVRVDMSPGITVERLDLSLSPGDVVPANGNLVAVATLTANPEAAGAVVALDTSLGRFSGDADRVTLGGDGEGDATAMIGFEADPGDAGTAIVVATAEGILESEALIIAGAPGLTPPTAQLDPAQQQVVTVDAAGGLESCFATTASPGAFTTDPDLLGAEQGPDSDGRLVFTVRADDEAMPGSTLRVRCCDRFGQCSADDVGIFEVP